MDLLKRIIFCHTSGRASGGSLFRKARTVCKLIQTIGLFADGAYHSAHHIYLSATVEPRRVALEDNVHFLSSCMTPSTPMLDQAFW